MKVVSEDKKQNLKIMETISPEKSKESSEVSTPIKAQTQWQFFEGKWLEASAKAAGILKYKKHVAGYRKTRFGSSPIYDGLLLMPEDYDRLTAYFEKKEAVQAQRNSTASKERSQKLRANQDEKIRVFIRSRWRLDDTEVEDFIAHANVPGSGRVARTRSLAFEEKVTKALVAWVRHNKTGYEQELRSRKYEIQTQFRAAIDSLNADKKALGWYVFKSFLKHAINQKKEEEGAVRNELQISFIKEAHGWLNQRLVDPQIGWLTWQEALNPAANNLEASSKKVAS